MNNDKTRFHLTYASQGKKIGLMSVGRSTTNTCPPSCALYSKDGKGPCYDMLGHGGIHRRNHDAGKYQSFTQSEFVNIIRYDPRITDVWRMFEGGDMPGEGDRLDEKSCLEIIDACNESGKKPIIYTHKPIYGVQLRGSLEDRLHNRDVLCKMMKRADGFAINISCDTPEEAKRALLFGFDATLVQASDAPRTVKEVGKPLTVGCPNSHDERVQCSPHAKITGKKPCGSGEPLCLRPGRQYVVGFPAHGTQKKLIDLRIAQGGA